MPNRVLTGEEREKLFTPLFAEVKRKLQELSGGDAALLFALRRKLGKELSYEERGKPMARRTLKLKKHSEQVGKCAVCKDILPDFGKDAVLDRTEAIEGYTLENTRLLCSKCDRAEQKKRNYA